MIGRHAKGYWSRYVGRKWYEVLGHVVLSMVLPVVSAVREWWQWPPGVSSEPVMWVWAIKGMSWFNAAVDKLSVPENAHPMEYVSARRTRDGYADFTDALVGSQITIVVLTGLLIWRW